MMTDLTDYLTAYYSEIHPAPAWAIGDLAMHPTMGKVVITAVAASGGFPRYLVVSDPAGARFYDVPCVLRESVWVSGCFLS